MTAPRRAPQRIIVTGANGAGKSHTAARLAAVWPAVPLVSFDAIKLQRDWRQRPRSEIDASLAAVVRGEAWILEGGPSLLPLALPRANAVIWLDPPGHVRGWRLLVRPWKHWGRTRSELPAGNVDRVMQQYQFALRSLARGRRTGSFIAETLREASGIEVWRCQTERDVAEVVSEWGACPL